MKFDLTLDPSDIELGKRLVSDLSLENRPILLAASTHDPEEKLIIDAFKVLKEEVSDLLLVVVPRHPQRFEEVYQLISATGVSVVRISDKANSNLDDPISSKLDCLLMDVMGQLKACYSVCDVAFVGGSFAQKGGHNALEAALFAKPSIMGPSIYNNPIICELLQQKEALKVVDKEEELIETARLWLAKPDIAKELGKSGVNVISENAGAVKYTLSVVHSLLEKSKK